MKVIGKSENGYLCDVTHNELEKFLNLYYNKMKELKIGEFIDLGKGYDFLKDANDALKETQRFIESNKRIIQCILSGIEFMGIEKEVKK